MNKPKQAARLIWAEVKPAVLLGSLMVALMIMFVLGLIIGKDQGRAEFHLELIKEMDAKGGAPVLLYPPDGHEADGSYRK